ncbi:hypothetical protein E1263_28495 [Kribbella antibiotica]|uniref:Cardiolipin synthase N-terminal domain-containing protein n=1 Tax=Kribbella antibiotica TaxID=190195 RepID=A0A4R4Z4U0_9ACTN|nr:PLD nuclease N-terminal domain-containing protein [Kribbella antibiotica]TDD53043.1 hypothetical protein E1263_28495 [Kribbella antibiotica]
MGRYLPFLISLVLSIYALFSCIQTPDDEVPHLPKLVWIVIIVFVPFVGPIVWLLMQRNARIGRERPASGPSRPASRSSAPDDDPDFLKSLDRYRDPRTTKRPADEPKGTPEPKDPDPPVDEQPTGDSPPAETDDNKP